ncbi:glycosyltransferase [Microbacterium sp. GXS0129]|uniref:glycosyltransferase n=1 Tax=Microbacterium sp. GXS0129 TaxID=3377836 RepID=UPI00383B3DFA
MTRPLRVMQSFAAPRTTTNPYITMLAQSLRDEPNVELVTFSWPRALFGRYQAFHWHWPEARLAAGSPLRRRLKKVLLRLLAQRHRRSRRIGVVRTAHNPDLPNIADDERALLMDIQADADVVIRLNPTTSVDAGVLVRDIPHGDYRSWFDGHSRLRRRAGHVVTFGQLRGYKGVEDLLSAFSQAHDADPALSLTVAGRPTSAELTARLLATAGAGVELDLRFVPDEDLVRIISSASLVVLAYRDLHNSGSALAALSLNRPVLVPRSASTDALAEDVGEEWVIRYEHLDGTVLREAIAAAERLDMDSAPDLSRRDWGEAGRLHAEAYRAARAHRRSR